MKNKKRKSTQEKLTPLQMVGRLFGKRLLESITSLKLRFRIGLTCLLQAENLSDL